MLAWRQRRTAASPLRNPPPVSPILYTYFTYFTYLTRFYLNHGAACFLPGVNTNPGVKCGSPNLGVCPPPLFPTTTTSLWYPPSTTTDGIPPPVSQGLSAIGFPPGVVNEGWTDLVLSPSGIPTFTPPVSPPTPPPPGIPGLQ